MSRARLDRAELVAVGAELEGSDPERVLAWAFDRFERVALVASFQVTSSVLIDMAARLRPGVEVVTLDTGRLPQETLDLIDLIQRRYPVRIRLVSPDPDEISEMAGEHGINLFYRSPALRNLCCEVRKSRPLKRALAGFDAWVTGLRRAQAPTRAATPVVASDEDHAGIAKVAPLVNWSADRIWDYVHSRHLPYNSLYNKNFTSIGCAPCTRATLPGQQERAGRWWWEGDSAKECGLHWTGRGRGVSRSAAATIGEAS